MGPEALNIARAARLPHTLPLPDGVRPTLPRTVAKIAREEHLSVRTLSQAFETRPAASS